MLKSPVVASSRSLISKVIVSQYTTIWDKFSEDRTFEDFLKTNYAGHVKSFFADRKELAKS